MTNFWDPWVFDVVERCSICNVKKHNRKTSVPGYERGRRRSYPSAQSPTSQQRTRYFFPSTCMLSVKVYASTGAGWSSSGGKPVLNRRNKAVFPTAESPRKTIFRSKGCWSNSAAVAVEVRGVSRVWRHFRIGQHRSHVVSGLRDAIACSSRDSRARIDEHTSSLHAVDAFKWARNGDCALKYFDG